MGVSTTSILSPPSTGTRQMPGAPPGFEYYRHLPSYDSLPYMPPFFVTWAAAPPSIGIVQIWWLGFRSEKKQIHRPSCDQLGKCSAVLSRVKALGSLRQHLSHRNSNSLNQRPRRQSSSHQVTTVGIQREYGSRSIASGSTHRYLRPRG
jgi:hypothetical protein